MPERQNRKDAPGSEARADAGSKAGGKPGGEPAFDLWLRRGLHQLYDDVAQEPIPEALLRLIQEDEERDQDE